MRAALLAIGGMLAVSACSSGPAAAPDMNVPADAPTASVPFIHFNVIENWRAQGTKAITLKTYSGEFYIATFTQPCLNLPFAEQIGFDIKGTDTLTKFDSIIARGEHCYFDSFDQIQIPKPPPL